MQLVTIFTIKKDRIPSFTLFTFHIFPKFGSSREVSFFEKDQFITYFSECYREQNYIGLCSLVLKTSH